LRRESNSWIENFDRSREFSEDKFIEILSIGPSQDDIANNRHIKKDIVLETLKVGDIFPAYFSVNNITLDVDFISDSPSEVIIMKVSDIQDLLPVKNYSKLLKI